MSRWNGLLVLGLLPLWLLIYEIVIAPSAIESVTQNPPALVGLPVGILLDLAALLLMAAGIVALRRTTSTGGTIAALLGFTIPAAVVVAIAPLLIGIASLSWT